MFFNSKFNGDISKWNVSHVEEMSYMFSNSKFNGDISNWNISNIENILKIFEYSKLKKENKLPYWYLPTQKERVEAYLKSQAIKERKNIEVFLNLSTINEFDKKIKSNKL